MTSLNPLKTIGDQIMEAVELHQHLKGKAAREKTLEYLRDVGIADPRCALRSIPTSFRAVCASASSLPLRWPATRRS